MNLKENQQIKEIIGRLRKGMLSFIEEDDYYTPEDVETCIQILNSYLEQMSSVSNKNTATRIIKETVFLLNDLNKQCDGVLIETGQREDICEIIIMASHLKGYNDMSEDITEEWREW